MAANVHELTLSSYAKDIGVSEVLRDILQNTGLRDDEIFEYQKNSRIFLSVFFKDKRKANRITKVFTDLKLKKVRFNLKSLKPRDWQNRYKEDFKPVRIAKSFIVVPEWTRKKFVKKGRTPIFMGESFAFGTGQHETTRFMSELIEQSSKKFGSFLDIGTGTGILSLVATKCGANDITAIDMDENCTKAVKVNLKINGYKNGTIKLTDIKSFKQNRKYDFVAANLITHTLIKFKRKILSCVKKGQYLAVSGISNENLSMLKKEYKKLPLRCLKILTGKDWSAILYKRIA